MTFQCVVHCIHGFLGQATDWDAVLPSGVRQKCYDLFPKGLSWQVPMSLRDYGKWINHSASEYSGSRVLLGYSFGGRIALHALMDSPRLWTAAIIVSAHPGLISDAERERRFQADLKWAQRFRTENWSSLLQDWNSQPVLRVGGAPLPRVEESFSRGTLSDVMEHCSLGLQANLRSKLVHLSIPILWISGELDAKFCAIAKEMVQLNPQFQIRSIPRAGHRVPWDQPELFKQAVFEYLTNWE